MGPTFLLTSIVVILLPGTGVLYTLAVGLNRGWRASVLAAFGCTLGILPSAAASVTGLATLLYASSLAFQAIKYAGAVYLFYLAWQLLRDRGTLQLAERDPDVAALPARRIVAGGFLLNILNPKLALFFLAFLPQFVPAHAPHATAHMLSLAAAFMGLTFVVFVGYGAFASAARHYVISRPRVMLWFKR
ncbi:LysE family translocator, partial [Acidihalobacter prosperus]